MTNSGDDPETGRKNGAMDNADVSIAARRDRLTRSHPAMTANDAVDGSSTGTQVPWMWGLTARLERDACRQMAKSPQ